MNKRLLESFSEHFEEQKALEFYNLHEVQYAENGRRGVLSVELEIVSD